MASPTPALVALSCSLLLGSALTAQDLIAVDFSGQAYTLNSLTGAGNLLGNTGKTGHNAMARSARTLVTNEIVGSGTSAQHFLDIVDEQTGAATRSSQITFDLRALAASQPGFLVGVAQASPHDVLVRVNLTTGAITQIGVTGFTSIQALVLFQGTFYAWDLNAGLLRVDHLTGVATDVNPNVGNGGAQIQFMTALSDGRVVGGQNALYGIDVVTGVPTLIGSGSYSDLRGAAERFGSIVNFGVACGGIGLKGSGVPKAGTTIQTTSIGNAPGAAGVAMLGFSKTVAGTFPLPLDLDPLLGTAGCSLLVSPDFSFPLTASSSGAIAFPIAIPVATNGLIFHVQHASLKAVPGGLALTNAITARISL